MTKIQTYLSDKTLKLFESVADVLKRVNPDEIEFELKEDNDFVRISSSENNRDSVKFYIDFFNGYCDFFIGEGNEVFIQREFKSPLAAKEYFEEFLTSPIRYSKSEDQEGRVLEEEYRLLNSGIVFSGQKRFTIKSKEQLKNSVKIFEPWIIK